MLKPPDRSRKSGHESRRNGGGPRSKADRLRRSAHRTHATGHRSRSSSGEAQSTAHGPRSTSRESPSSGGGSRSTGGGLRSTAGGSRSTEGESRSTGGEARGNGGFAQVIRGEGRGMDGGSARTGHDSSSMRLLVMVTCAWLAACGSTSGGPSAGDASVEGGLATEGVSAAVPVLLERRLAARDEPVCRRHRRRCSRGSRRLKRATWESGASPCRRWHWSSRRSCRRPSCAGRGPSESRRRSRFLPRAVRTRSPWSSASRWPTR